MGGRPSVLQAGHRRARPRTAVATDVLKRENVQNPTSSPSSPEPTAPTASYAAATTCATVPNSLTFEATLPLEAATAATHANGSPRRRITAGEFHVNHRLGHPWAHRRLRCQQNRQSNRRRRHLGRSSRNRWSSCRGLALPHLRNERRKRTQCL